MLSGAGFQVRTKHIRKSDLHSSLESPILTCFLVVYFASEIIDPKVCFTLVFYVREEAIQIFIHVNVSFRLARCSVPATLYI